MKKLWVIILLWLIYHYIGGCYTYLNDIVDWLRYPSPFLLLIFDQVPKISEDEDQKITETSVCSEENDDNNGVEGVGEIKHQTGSEPQPLPVMKARWPLLLTESNIRLRCYNKIYLCYRQLLSWYTLSHNANVSGTDNNPALLPLWVRCDMSDPAGTTWLGAETICISNKVSGVKLYSITCKGIIAVT